MIAIDRFAQLFRLLLSHLLILLWHLQLSLAFAGDLGWSVWLCTLLPLAVFITLASWVSFHFYYPPRKLLAVHLVSFVGGLLALLLQPVLISVAFLLTLATVVYPCKQCIRLKLPAFFDEGRL